MKCDMKNEKNLKMFLYSKIVAHFEAFCHRSFSIIPLFLNSDLARLDHVFILYKMYVYTLNFLECIKKQCLT